MALEVGDRVSRPIEIGRPARKYGMVVNKYKSRQSSTHAPYTLYSIVWDDAPGVESHGYFESGLQREDNSDRTVPA